MKKRKMDEFQEQERISEETSKRLKDYIEKRRIENEQKKEELEKKKNGRLYERRKRK